MEASASEQPARDQKRHNGIPVLAASIVLVVLALGWKLMGAGVVVHFVVLLIGITIGAASFRQSAVGRDGVAEIATTAAAGAAGVMTIDNGAGAGDGAPVSSNDCVQDTPAGGQESLILSFLANTATTISGASSAGGAPASPLHWVGETMEGSINWLCGNNGNGRRTAAAAAAAEHSNGRGSAVGGRRRSRSTGGGLPTGPAGSEQDTAVAAVVARSAATSPARRAETGALPPLGAGIPQQGQAPARSRLWSRTFGRGAGTGVQQPPLAEGSATDARDGDDSSSVDGDDEGGTDEDESSRLRGGAGDWLVGTGLGDTR